MTIIDIDAHLHGCDAMSTSAEAHTIVKCRCWQTCSRPCFEKASFLVDCRHGL